MDAEANDGRQSQSHNRAGILRTPKKQQYSHREIRLLTDLINDPILTAISFENNENLKRHLCDHYQICYRRDPLHYLDTILESGPHQTAEAYFNLQAQAVGGAFDQDQEKQFYDLTQEQPLFGAVTSQRWLEIFGATSYCTAVLKHLDIEGPVWDDGCNAGYISTWLKMQLDRNVVGFDTSEAMTRFAEATAGEITATDPPSFRCEPMQRCDNADDSPAAIVSIKGSIFLQTHCLSRASNLLRQGGILILLHEGISPLVSKPKKLSKMLDAAGLSLLTTDVVGGFDGSDYFPDPLLVLQKGGNHQKTDQLLETCNRAWTDEFKSTWLD